MAELHQLFKSMALRRKNTEPTISVLEDIYTGNIYELPRVPSGSGKSMPWFDVGRSSGCDLVIPQTDYHSKLVSRNHCRIFHRENEGFYVVDNGSSCGTFIDGKPLIEDPNLRTNHLGRILTLGRSGDESYDLRLRVAPQNVVDKKMAELGKKLIKVDFSREALAIFGRQRIK